MHEMGITETLLAIVLEKAAEEQASKVTEIQIDVGELTNTVPDCIEFYFENISRNTVAEGARLKFKTVPVTARCSGCGQVKVVKEMMFICPDCSGILGEVLSGRDLEIVKIKMDRGARIKKVGKPG